MESMKDNNINNNIKIRLYLPSSHHFPLFSSSLLKAYFCKSAKVSIINPKMNTQQPIVSKVVIVLGAPALMELCGALITIIGKLTINTQIA